tara:strand:- start:747 stop:1658 length:912 start_codon:yes stop_codon:yes gene_type:complete
MKSLLILGCGYVGSAFAKEALARGLRVVAVTRNEGTVLRLKSEGVEAYAVRVDSDEWHGLVGGGFDFALNCVSSAGNGLDGYRASYLGGNRSFVKWMKCSGFSGRAVYTGSVSVYPDSAGAWLEETDAIPGTERGSIVMESEEIFREGLGGVIQGTVLRLGGIYGPERHMLLNRVRSGQAELSGFGEYYLNLIRLEDIISAMWAVFLFEGKALKASYNVVDDVPSSKNEIVSWMAEQLGLESPEFSGVANGESSRRFSATGRGSSNRRISNGLLREHVGWCPRYKSFRDGFKDLIEAGEKGLT